MREHKIFFFKKKSNITSILNFSFDGHGHFPQSYQIRVIACLIKKKKEYFFIRVCFEFFYKFLLNYFC